MDDELEALQGGPVEMSLKVVCPACGQWLRLPENEPIPAPAAPADILRAMMSQSRLVDDDASSSRPPERTPAKRPQQTPAKRKPWWKFW
jgi:hypothetical protein